MNLTVRHWLLGSGVVILALLGAFLLGAFGPPVGGEPTRPSGSSEVQPSQRAAVETPFTVLPIERVENPMSLQELGATEPGEQAAPAVIYFRVVDTDGQPIAHQLAHVQASWKAPDSIVATTNEEGRVEVRLFEGDHIETNPGPSRVESLFDEGRLFGDERGFTAPERGVPVSLYIAADGTLPPILASPHRFSFENAVVEGMPSATVTFGYQGPGQRIDLGDVRLQHAPVLATGVLRSSFGDEPRELMWQWDEPRGDLLGSTFFENSQVYARVGEGGRFRVYAPVGRDRLTVWVRDPAREERTWRGVELRRGMAGVTIQLEPERMIPVEFTGQGAKADAAPSVDLLVLPEVPDPSWLPRSMTRDRNGVLQVEFGPVPSAYHDLAVRPPVGRRLLGSGTDGVLRIGGLWVPRTGSIPDGRIRGIRVF